MTARAGAWRPRDTTLAGLGAVVALAAVAAAAPQLGTIAVLVAVAGAVFALLSHRFLLRWEVQVSLIVLIALWVPLDRYELGGSLPFKLEPYRVLVVAVAFGWCAALLADRSMQWKRIGLFGPLLALVLAVFASSALNTDRIEQFAILPEVGKSLTLFASYVIVLLVVSSVITKRDQLDTVIKVLVGGGAVVAAFTVVQYRTGYNVFDHMGGLPLLQAVPDAIPTNLGERGEGTRVYASAEHPIALSAALVMLLPLGIYAARRWEGRVWWVATALIGIAALSTVARTGATMLLTVLVVLLIFKPRDVLGMWKWGLACLVAVYLLSPGALGGLKGAFFPQGGLIAEQQYAYSEGSSNRLADVGPSLQKWWQRPYLGYGYGTRISDPLSPKANALILDNQWLNLLLDVGLAGVLALLWLFARVIRRLGAAARADPSPHGWLLTGLAASIAAFAIGMLTFDAFAFGQVTVLMFILVGLSAPAIRLARPPLGAAR